MRLDRKGYYTAGREKVARFLKHLDDDRGKRLLKLGQQNNTFLTKSRNLSLLVHGFRAEAVNNEADIDQTIDELEAFLTEDFTEAKAYLEAARSMSFHSE